ncbi:hypothetical protein GOP47_0021521 [Adiantum capillus-veneris]|uniref:Uncharacterized protein n=1 Tax=Adiantum capillus-veneris TaxID=13818 RepID=A0A9D4U7K5_ADICA|nr:hypothetical protein GOP47_0021521 [Adiantum capillus-veneris]
MAGIIDLGTLLTIFGLLEFINYFCERSESDEVLLGLPRDIHHKSDLRNALRAAFLVRPAHSSLCLRSYAFTAQCCAFFT